MNEHRIQSLHAAFDRALARVESARRELRAAKSQAPRDEDEHRTIERFEAEVRAAERDASYLEIQIIQAESA